MSEWGTVILRGELKVTESETYLELEDVVDALEFLLVSIWGYVSYSDLHVVADLFSQKDVRMRLLSWPQAIGGSNQVEECSYLALNSSKDSSWWGSFCNLAVTAKVLCWMAAERRTVGLERARGAAAERAARRNDAAKDIGCMNGREERCRLNERVVIEDIILLQCCLGRRRAVPTIQSLGQRHRGYTRHITCVPAIFDVRYCTCLARSMPPRDCNYLYTILTMATSGLEIRLGTLVFVCWYESDHACEWSSRECCALGASEAQNDTPIHYRKQFQHNVYTYARRSGTASAPRGIHHL